MRLFVAINLPDAERSRLEVLLAAVRHENLPVRWVERDSLHLTLMFLGEASDAARAAMPAALSRAAAGVQPFALRVAGFGAFPSLRRPSVFWLGVDAPAALFGLQERVQSEFEMLGFAREVRAFSPHLTLGRVKSERRVERADVDRIAARFVYNADISVHTIDLMRSHLGPRGARYEMLESAALRKG